MATIKKGLVLTMNRNYLGEDKELGENLIKVYFATLAETSELPETIIFYNSAVKLMCEEGQILDEGTVALDAKFFSEIVRKLPDSEVTIDVENNFVTKITCENSKFNLMGKDGEDFTALPKINKTDNIILSELSFYVNLIISSLFIENSFIYKYNKYFCLQLLFKLFIKINSYFFIFVINK